MNTPNVLTLIRVLMVPVFMWALLSGFYLAAIVIFAIASLTDHLDGYLARKNNQVTTFGKLMDPLADKILTISALVCLCGMNADFVSPAVVMIIIARELIVTGVRQLAMGEKTVIAASWWGKAKTVSQMAAIIGVMLDLAVPGVLRIGTEFWGALTFWLVLVTVVLTVYSGLDYIVKNRKLITFK
ncbi:MAG: CDP-diacylglycerol--glycerol-3-phosphate 3-phosphatidyltransferase [Clostridia bacterium]|nr:CDP-diacylglycerol--glycerol-3-phosphate 3-phosphatidyltransferase [Clostridia bacterium]